MNETKADWEAASQIAKMADRIFVEQANQGFANLSSEDRRFYCVYKVELEVKNGGLYQLIVNTAPEVLRAIPASLREINALATAHIVERSYDIVLGRIADTLRQHELMLKQVKDAELEQLATLDNAFYATNEQLCTLLLANLRSEGRGESV